MYEDFRSCNGTGEFDDVLDSQNIKGRSESMERILINFCSISAMETLETNGSFSLDKSVKLLDVEHLTLQTPMSGTTLIRDLSVEICENDHLLVGFPLYLLFHSYVSLVRFYGM